MGHGPSLFLKRRYDDHLPQHLGQPANQHPVACPMAGTSESHGPISASERTVSAAWACSTVQPSGSPHSTLCDAPGGQVEIIVTEDSAPPGQGSLHKARQAFAPHLDCQRLPVQRISVRSCGSGRGMFFSGTKVATCSARRNVPSHSSATNTTRFQFTFPFLCEKSSFSWQAADWPG